MAAYPLASEKSLELALIELRPRVAPRASLSDERTPTQQLWRECEAQYAPHTGWSLDRLLLGRDRAWFGEMAGSNNDSVPLHGYLRSLARSYFVAREGATVIQQATDPTSIDALDHYRWLTLALPEDLLLGALGVDPPPDHIEVHPPLLVRRLFDQGMAEIHHHVGAGMSFPMLWASALAAVADPRVKADELKSPGAPLNDGKQMVHWLLTGAVARLAVAETVISGKVELLSNPSALLDGYGGGTWSASERDTLILAFKALLRGKAAFLPAFEALRDLYVALHPTAREVVDRGGLEDPRDVFEKCDPIAVRLRLKGPNAGERWFLRKGFQYLQKDQGRAADDVSRELFARLFWQIIRIRCQYYRSVVQRPLTGGLQWFIRFYDRIKPLARPLDPILPQVSYSTAGEGDRVRALEIRHSVDDSSLKIAERLHHYLCSWQKVLNYKSSSMFEPEFGVIYNFNKERDADKQWAQGTPPAFSMNSHMQPGYDGRYASYYEKQCRKARALGELIRDMPALLWVIRGIDVASDEMGVPTWVLVPLFRHLHEVSARESIRKNEGAGPPLRITAHVGEDFRHLLEGLRRIYEQVDYILDGGPGRIGHGIALGVEPRAWADSVRSVLMPMEERLWDLVWEWRLYSRYKTRPHYHATPPKGRVQEITAEVQQLAHHIFCVDPGDDLSQCLTLTTLAEAHHLLHMLLVPPFQPEPRVDGSPDAFAKAAERLLTVAPNVPIQDRRAVAKLLYRYMTSEAVFRRGQTVVDVRPSKEVDALRAVQNAMRRGIAINGIVVEVNPSSNLLIGDLLDLRNHPVLRLFPPEPTEDDLPPVPIALGSDDPITFSTRLLHEYTVLYETARAAGFSDRTAHAWLENIRSTGMDARFTTVWHPSAEKKNQELIRRLCEYLQLPDTERGHHDR